MVDEARYGLADVETAYAALAAGKARGKIVIDVA